MALLDIISTIDMNDGGTIVVGKQGAAANSRILPLQMSVGAVVTKFQDNAMADAAAVTLWDTTTSPSATMKICWVWTSVAMAVQLIDSSNNVSLQTVPFMPLVVGPDMLAATGTTKISADPATEVIASIVLQNLSGSLGAYLAYVID